ncbi:esterase-like activity of phytase family protein [Streptomyces cinnabarinus]|uniref:Esterase-like activity of phytase family protein n=1 Tax=Streptomyces cinnabarinus TaxID=67287 RepID=A0ABY7KFG0_9ACTN|nr:esterase-like activity of phytase family protein [Streptomyces cinnabarinus]WAZ21491.1 esterase-like activity of phytase family protein [Streptomyces cinnabarinus]
MSEALPDPGASAAVLIGVAAYRSMPKLPTVARNLTRVKEALTDRAVWGLPPDRCVVVLDPKSSDELIDPVVQAARSARDTLIVYYAGHGFVDPLGALRLTMIGSMEELPHKAVLYSELREALRRHNRARRRVIILDCCYSGRALGDMDAQTRTPLRTVADVEGMAGSYLLTSAASNVRALAPRGEECTAFTGEFVRVLREGIPGRDGQRTPPFLTLDAIYREVRGSLHHHGRPTPRQQDNNQVGRLPFVRNLAHPLPPDRFLPPAPRPPWQRRTAFALAALAPVAVLAADSGILPSDVCSPRASLIGFSDRLDKVTFQGRRLAGLSSLAVTAENPTGATALSLADNSSPALFRLALGAPGKPPEPEITGLTGLVRSDGRPYGEQGFDGEAIAVEEGGRTVLVASEYRPSIGRYSLATGKLLDELPVPEAFRADIPAGDAQRGAIFESLALSPDGKRLYVGLEDPLGRDGTWRGGNRIRVLRYTGEPGGAYRVDGQIAYETDSGLRLAELAPVGDGRFLALERGYTEGQGNSIRVYEVSLTGLPDVSEVRSLEKTTASAFVVKRELVDLGDCPPSGARAEQPQVNPLLDNAEGMALGRPLAEEPHRGRRVLYLVTDDNDNPEQITRLYTLAVDVS